MKNAIRIAVFILIFTLIFTFLQNVFILKDYDAVAFAQVFNEPEDSIDVIILGSSTTRSSVLPAVLWQEAGISSYNLSGSASTYAAQYYVFKEVLSYQSPSLVIVSSESLFAEEEFDNNEVRYRTALDHLPLSLSKLESIADIVSNSNEQSFASYLFPFLRYHNRRDLTSEDFNFSYRLQRNLLMSSQDDRDTVYLEVYRPEVFSDVAYNCESELYDKYIMRIIELCNDNGIAVVLYMPPTCDRDLWSIKKHEMMQDFADKHGILLADLNTDELFSMIGLDVLRDFEDFGHTNVSGGTKASKYIATFLSENYDLTDRREPGYDLHWDAVMETYHERYNMLLNQWGN